MNTRIETRELITLAGSDAPVRATYHPVCDRDLSADSPAGRPVNVGILFLNSLSPTRAAHGDSAVYWADSFAQAGYPSVRVDLPGFGDSAGEPPPELLHFINTGGYAALASAKAAEAAAHFGWPGVVVVGLCAGAVSAVFTAAACKQCAGLILLDPYFHLPFQDKSKLWQKLTGRISRSTAGRWVTMGCESIKSIRHSLLGDTLPENANTPLLNCWRNLSSAGLPMLVFKLPASRLRAGEFDYFAFLKRKGGRSSKVVVKTIEGAGHTFSNTVGREAVRSGAIHWLNLHFAQRPSLELAFDNFDSSSARTDICCDSDTGRVHV